MSIFSNLTAEQFETIGQELDAIRNLGITHQQTLKIRCKFSSL